MAANTAPFEVLSQIFSYLPATDLPRLALVSPHWYGPAQEALYRAPCLSPATLLKFLRTLLTPDLDTLSTHVRTLSITWDTSPAGPLDPPDLARLEAAAVRHMAARPHLLTNDFVELLLHLLPRVLDLHLSPPITPSGDGDFLDVPPFPAAFRSLRAISCTWPSQQRGISAALLAALLALPTLRTMTANLSPDATAPAALFAPHSSGITTLHISTALPRDLAPLLAAPRALKHLSVTTATRIGALPLPTLHAALAPLRASLQVLEMRFGRGTRLYGGHDVPVATTPAQTLRDWPCLRALRCPLRVLLGDRGAPGGRRLWEVVPDTLCEVAVATDLTWGSVPAVEEFGELVWRKREMGVTPGLCRGTVDLYREDERIVWWMIRELCESTGVVLLEGGFEFVGADGGAALQRLP